jgi:hypothetical protein
LVNQQSGKKAQISYKTKQKWIESECKDLVEQGFNEQNFIKITAFSIIIWGKSKNLQRKQKSVIQQNNNK